MPPKRSRLDNRDESDMQESIKQMKEEIQEKFEVHKRDISKQLDEKINELKEQLSKANEKQPLEKEFILEHKFTNMSEMEAESSRCSEIEEHYGRRWYINIKRTGEHLGVYFGVKEPDSAKEWSIETELGFELVGENYFMVAEKKLGMLLFKDNESYGLPEYLTWKEMKEDYLKNDTLEVVARVTILNITGIVQPKAFDFGEANKEHSDVVLNVAGEKFYVFKRDLTRHSENFTTLFSEKLKEGNASEIEIHKTNAQDFQKFLEVLHFHAKPNEHTVEGILLVNNRYNAENVRRKCEKFLIKRSNLPLKKKLELSARFQLNSLTDKCVSGIGAQEYKALVTEEFLEQVNLYVATSLVEKAATLL